MSVEVDMNAGVRGLPQGLVDLLRTKPSVQRPTGLGIA